MIYLFRQNQTMTNTVYHVYPTLSVDLELERAALGSVTGVEVQSPRCTGWTHNPQVRGRSIDSVGRKPSTTTVDVCAQNRPAYVYRLALSSIGLY